MSRPRGKTTTITLNADEVILIKDAIALLSARLASDLPTDPSALRSYEVATRLQPRLTRARLRLLGGTQGATT